MPRDPDDDLETRQTLDEWLAARPDAAIVVAAIDRDEDGDLDVALKLSALTGYHLIGLVQALIEETLAIVEESEGAKLAPEYDTLRRVGELLKGGPPQLMPLLDGA